MEVRSSLWGVWGSALFSVVFAYAAPARADNCQLIDNSADKETKERFLNLRKDANDNGGYVFIFRHSNKKEKERGLTIDGSNAAKSANFYMKDAISSPDGVIVVEMQYGENIRVDQTRIGVIEGRDRRSGETADDVLSFARDGDPLKHLSKRKGKANYFAFANSTVLDELNKTTEKPSIRCLEGIFYKADEDIAEGKAKCFRFFPSQWVADDPANVQLPVWVGQPKGMLNPSGACG